MKGVLIIIAIFAVSCVSQKQITYIQPKDGKASYLVQRNELLIKPYDQLYINVTSIDQPSYNFFSQDQGSYGVTSELLSVISYTVNDSGQVKLPVIGKLKISDNTLDQSEKLIENAYRNYLNSPSVTVKYINNLVTVLGEVGNPGSYPFQTPQITIFNAIGLAGDISEYGNRKKVTLIREGKNKEIRRYYLDLTKDDILQSENLYIRPNDIIIIEPLRRRWWDMQKFPFELIFSSVTTAILVISFTEGRY